MKRWMVVLFLCSFILGACTPLEKLNLPGSAALPAKAPTATAPAVGSDAFASYQLQRLGRGVNLGNALEAPKEGEWGVVLKEEYFQKIKAAGFNSVRIPIRWSAHTQKTAPYTIEADFMARVDWAVSQALKNDLAVVINMHHFDELFADPDAEKAHFLAIWEQIGAHFKTAPDAVMFELLNEPNGKLEWDKWNDLAKTALKVVRSSNPNRTVVIGPANWNSLTALNELSLPSDDRNLIITFHFYEPFQFTHQGADWVNGSDAWMGTKWQADDNQKNALAKALDQAAAWGKEHKRPIYLGEFGAFSKADPESRHLWTDAVARGAESRGMAWAYWEFCSGFGVYDPNSEQWNEPIRSALLPAQ